MKKSLTILLFTTAFLLGGFFSLPHAAFAAAQGALGGACYSDHQCDGAYICNNINFCQIDPNLDVSTPAQNPGTTNQASVLTPDVATKDWQTCTKSAVLGKCQVTLNNVNVSCENTIEFGRWSCDYKYPDGSLVTADPNAFVGSTFRNFDSQGNLLGQSDTGLAKTSDGTLAKTNLDTSAAQNSCSLGNTGNLGTCLSNIIFDVIKQIALFFLFLAAFFAGMAGYLFNEVMYITVFQFGNLIGNNVGLLAAWGVLRDIGNILLLFGFIFMGISTILSLPGNEFTAKRALPALIIFAVLMNFSLFAAEAVIDVSNAAGTTLYKQAGQGVCPTSSSAVDCATNYGIGGSILKLSGISAIFDPSVQNTITAPGLTGAIIALGLTIFAAVAAFVFMAAVFMFITRAVVLAFLMAISPIGFAGMAIPPLHGLASQWWSQLLKQSFFAPIYILLMLVSLKFMQGITVALNIASASGNANLASAFSASGASNVSVVIDFILIIGFMLGSIQMSRSMGAMGAGAATKYSGALVFGGMARVSNMGIGGASRLARFGVQRTLGRANADTRLGRMALAVGSGTSAFLKGGEKLNTDLRALGLGGVIAKQGGGGPAENASYDAVQHQIQGVKENLRANRAEFDRDISQQRLRRDLAAGTLSAESERFFSTLSGEEIAGDHDLEHLINEIAPRMSTGQFESFIRSKDTTLKLKDEARKARFQPLDAAIREANKREIRKWSAKDMEQFFSSPLYAQMRQEQEGLADDAIKPLEEMVSLMHESTYETLRASTSLTNAQRAEIKQSRDRARFSTTVQAISMDGRGALQFIDPTNGLLTDTDTGIKAYRIDRTIKDLNINDRASLQDSILGRKEVYERLMPGDFTALQQKSKLEDKERREVGDYIDRMLDDTSTKGDLFRAYTKSLSDGDWRKLKAFYTLKKDKAT